MDLFRTLGKTAMVSAIAVLALNATPAKAAEDVSDLGHISASVTGLLNIDEISAIKFGNMSIACTAGACSADNTVALSPGGTRVVTNGSDVITLLEGVGGADNGVADPDDQATGSQAPGFYDITNVGEGTGAENVYISFADNAGNIIDANHPDNEVVLTGPGAQTFTVDSFTFVSDDGTTGYVNAAASTNDIYGNWIPLVAGVATIRVGATLHTTVTAADYTVGHYQGTFYIMASY